MDTTPSDVNPSQLQALHEEHLQDDVDLLEQHLSTIRRAHRFLANQKHPPPPPVCFPVAIFEVTEHCTHIRICISFLP